MKPTRQQILQHREFLQRQKEYEQTYARMFLKVLKAQYRRAAKAYGEGIYSPNLIQQSDIEPIYRRLYRTLTIREAARTYRMEVLPILQEKHSNHEFQTKDIIDDLAGILGLNFDSTGRLIQLWRELLDDYLTIRILARIQNVTETTKDQIARIIERGIEQGLAAEDVARAIRNDAGGDINLNRSKLIARTETISALNQGKYMGVLSSNLQYRKKWLPAVDNRTRDAHLAMLDADYIDMETDFIVGGEAMACPGDARGSAANVCNCRCALVFQVKRDAQGRPMRKVNQLQAI